MLELAAAAGSHCVFYLRLHLFLVKKLRHVDACCGGKDEALCLYEQTLTNACTVFVFGLDDMVDQLDPEFQRSLKNQKAYRSMLRYLSIVLKMLLPSKLSCQLHAQGPACSLVHCGSSVCV